MRNLRRSLITIALLALTAPAIALPRIMDGNGGTLSPHTPEVPQHSHHGFQRMGYRVNPDYAGGYVIRGDSGGTVHCSPDYAGGYSCN